ncbi:hypothetical protein LX16_2683 [Stackebrandtia albiflava]|uniref:Uncharacterized protein n=1 Tax=Stackebrandtia albiflava TaxID=406432 RepID=A0A562V1Z1_9ACTN|nr:hypothetical protein [Stackebrandtia albiflava]TWJ11940.1 hypothetical protein LX16_2683 [Stackebrandtia albiflava]
MTGDATEPESETIRIPAVWPWLLGLGAAVIGVGLGFTVRPLVDWAVDALGGAPGPLRLLAQLPTGWAVAATTVLGVLVGLWLAHATVHDTLKVTVTPSAVRLSQKKNERHIARDAVGAVFKDGRELVFLDAATRRLGHGDAADLSAERLRRAFTRFGYPWRDGGDPYAADFRRWVDGMPGLDDRANTLLRRRSRALTDDREGTAADLLDELQGLGLIVRDRDGRQEYRRIPAGD